MSKLIYHNNGFSVSFFCPACNSPHTIDNRKWKLKDEDGIITISPSVLLTGVSDIYPEKNKICHSFVENNKIKYLNDCTHEFAGKEVELPDMPEIWK